MKNLFVILFFMSFAIFACMTNEVVAPLNKINIDSLDSVEAVHDSINHIYRLIGTWKSDTIYHNPNNKNGYDMIGDYIIIEKLPIDTFYWRGNYEFVIKYPQTSGILSKNGNEYEINQIWKTKLYDVDSIYFEISIHNDFIYPIKGKYLNDSTISFYVPTYYEPLSKPSLLHKSKK